MVKYLQDKNNQVFIFAMFTNLGVFVLVERGALMPAWVFASITGGFMMLAHGTIIPLLGELVLRLGQARQASKPPIEDRASQLLR